MDLSISEILKCPITNSSVRYLRESEIIKHNKSIANGEYVYSDGSKMTKSIKEGFISENGLFIYPVEDDIIIMNPTLAILTDKKRQHEFKVFSGGSKSVKEFYNSFGWNKDGDVFIDAAKFEDLREVSKEYHHICHLRLNKYLKANGRYLLDIASGPVQYDEYLTYSEGYDFRICADISISALYQAQKRLGKKGIYLLCDITNIPLADGSCGGVVSLHTIYHVPQENQLKAFQELHRVLEVNATAAIVYSWARRSVLMFIALFPFKLFSIALYPIIRLIFTKPDQRLYFKPFSYSWCKKNVVIPLSGEIYCWRSISYAFQKMYIHSFLFGKKILKVIYSLEDSFPLFLGRYGAYPLIVLKKKDSK